MRSFKSNENVHLFLFVCNDRLNCSMTGWIAFILSEIVWNSSNDALSSTCGGMVMTLTLTDNVRLGTLSKSMIHLFMISVRSVLASAQGWFRDVWFINCFQCIIELVSFLSAKDWISSVLLRFSAPGNSEVCPRVSITKECTVFSLLDPLNWLAMHLDGWRHHC